MTQQAVPAFPGGIWEQIVLPALVRNHNSNNSNSPACSLTFNQAAVCQLLCCSKTISSGVQA